MSETDILDRLKDMLNRAGLSDDKITAGATLTESGARKAARKLMIESTEVNPLIHALAARLRESETIDMEIVEALNDAPRFTLEKDIMQNVTVRDSQTGKSAFLRGSEASALLNRLKAGGDPQVLLARYANLMEAEPRAMTQDEEDHDGVSESAFVRAAKERLDALPEGFTDWVHEMPDLPEDTPELIGEGANSNVKLDEDQDFDHEIHNAHGAYNFPWRADGQHGYATARFKGRGRDMKIDILSIRTDEGEEIEDAGHLGEVVHEQAIAFIGQE